MKHKTLKHIILAIKGKNAYAASPYDQFSKSLNATQQASSYSSYSIPYPHQHQQSQQQFSPYNQNQTSQSVRTSTYIMPDQGSLLTASPASYSSRRSIQSFQHHVPKISSYLSQPRAKSYEQEETEIVYSRQQPQNFQQPRLLQTQQQQQSQLRQQQDDQDSQMYGSGSSIRNLTRRFEGSTSPHYSPTRRSNYSFELYQQSIGGNDQYKPKDDSYTSSFTRQYVQHQPPTQYRSLTDLTNQQHEFILKPTFGSGGRLNMQRIDRYGNELPGWVKHRVDSDEEEQQVRRSGPIVEEPRTPNYQTGFETQANRGFLYEQPRIVEQLQLVRRLPPALRKEEGEMVKLEFEVSGDLSEPVQVKWYKNGMSIRNTPDTRIISNRYGVYCLIIPEVFGEDSGLYKAVVEGGRAGNVESYCQLIVEGLHYILINRRSLLVSSLSTPAFFSSKF